MYAARSWSRWAAPNKFPVKTIHEESGEIRTPRCGGTGGGRPPPVTRWVWKRSQGRTSEAPPDERGGNRYVQPTATAPHLDSTGLSRWLGVEGVDDLDGPRMASPAGSGQSHQISARAKLLFGNAEPRCVIPCIAARSSPIYHK